jgi:putative hydrolase of the HAD superfamily
VRRIETVCLDAGGTLVWPNWTRVSAALAAEGVQIDPSALAAADPRVRRSFDEAHVIAATTDQRRGWSYFETILQTAGVAPSEGTERALAALAEYQRTTNLWEVVPAFVPETLVELRCLGCKLVVVSNANGTVRQAFHRLGLSALVDVVVDSGEEGVEKPDPRLFEIALARVGSTADRALHAGDIYHVDVVGARSAGLDAILVDEANLYADADCRRVASIAELPELVRGR